MYTSDVDEFSRKRYENTGNAAKTALIYGVATVICALFGAIYEAFSHGVMSFRMIYAFALPLLFGVVPFILIAVFAPNLYPGRVARNLYHAAVATLTVGCVFGGVVEIYGTTSPMTYVYLAAGLALVAAAGVVFAAETVRRKNAGESRAVN